MTAVRDKWIEDNWALANQVCSGTTIFPETLLTQAIVESQRDVNGTFIPGESELAKRFNNYFGIVADSSWKGTSVIRSDNGNQRKFRTYSSKMDGFKDYVRFLQVNPRYSSALKKTTSAEQLEAIAKAGYAENPNYNLLLQGVLKGIKKKAQTQQDLQ